MIEDITMMQAHGWEPEYDSRDRMMKRIPPNGVPQNGVGFVKGNVHIWQCRYGWQVAELIDGMYQNHRGQVSYMKEPFKGERYHSGYIPDLKTVLELDAKNDL